MYHVYFYIDVRSCTRAGRSIDWAFGVTLTGEGDIQVGADIPDDVAVWNQFAGSMLVTFRDSSNSGAYGFAATIGSFSIVPEPPTLSLLVIMSIFGTWTVIPTRNRC
jgi:hypothetical protein